MRAFSGVSDIFMIRRIAGNDLQRVAEREGTAMVTPENSVDQWRGCQIIPRTGPKRQGKVEGGSGKSGPGGVRNGGHAPRPGRQNSVGVQLAGQRGEEAGWRRTRGGRMTLC